MRKCRFEIGDIVYTNICEYYKTNSLRVTNVKLDIDLETGEPIDNYIITTERMRCEHCNQYIGTGVGDLGEGWFSKISFKEAK